jgi:hypothetical protein
MNTEIEKNSYSKKVIRLIFSIIYLFILLFLYYYLLQLGFNPIIIAFLLTLLFLITIGLFLKKTKGTLYSRIFPDKKRRSSINNHQSKIKREKVENKMQMKIPSHINLDSTYRKPLIKKCNGCGNILPSFAKKCPFCGKQII